MSLIVPAQYVRDRAQADRGQQIHESDIKRVLQKLNPDVHFDMGSALDIWHPKRNRWQGVFLKGRHISAMGRGWLPEFNIYRQTEDVDGRKVRQELLEIGWRTTLERIDKLQIPGLHWQAIAALLGVEYKKFTGKPADLEIPNEFVDPLYNTVG